MTRDYLSYWRSDTIDQLPDPFVLSHGASNQYYRVSKGDTVWIVTVRDGEVQLVGNIQVDLVTTYDEAKIRLGTDNLWPAKYHIFSTKEEVMTSCDLSISDIADQLRFDDDNDRLYPDNGLVDPEQLRVMRPLTPESALLLNVRLDQHNVSTFFRTLVDDCESDSSDSFESNVTHLQLTDDCKKEVISAHNLLYQYLNLREMSPNLSDWNEKILGDDAPRLIRLQRLLALFRAFQINCDPAQFVNGMFIDPSNDKYASLLVKLIDSTPEIRLYGFMPRANQMQSCFEILLSYREGVERVLSFNRGLLEASGLYLTAFNKTEQFNSIIRHNITVIDDILVEFISPDGREFTVEYLIKNYEYPDIDLSMLDMDY